jgi:CxxC motif-containing protein (DUF1111 family)
LARTPGAEGRDPAPGAEARDPAPVERGPAVAPADDLPSGRELFARQWLPHDPRSHGGDGLGPVYNETSCLACHGQAAPGGGGAEDKNVEILTMNLGTIGRQGVLDRDLMFTRTPALKSQNLVQPTSETLVDTLIAPDRNPGFPADGLVLSAGRSRLSGKLFRIQTDRDGHELVATSEEGQIRGETFTVRPDDRALMKIHPGLRLATSAVLHRFGVDPGYERWRSGLKARIPDDSAIDLVGARLSISRRNPPPLFGAGRIDALPDEVFVEAAAREPAATRGRVSRLEDGRIGRFGWKAQVATLGDFVLSACANELGLEVPGHHQAPSPLEPDAVARSLDLSQRECNALISYVRDLPAPVQLDPSDPSGSRAVAEGRRLFEYVGCAACHTPSLGPIEGIYSDLLLHDIGLTDGAVYYGGDAESPGAAKSSEWRTPPLWGVRDSAPYLHDGRARTLAEAVSLHGGEGVHAARAFTELSEGEKGQVLAFLSSLSAPVGPDEASRRQADPDLGAGQEQIRPRVGVDAARAQVRAIALQGRSPAELAPRAEEWRRQMEELAARAARQRQLAAPPAFPPSEHRRVAAARAARQHRLLDDPEAARAEAQRRHEAVKLAHLAATLRSAQALEKMGKVTGALDFYNALVREAPDSAEAQVAAERIKGLSP